MTKKHVWGNNPYARDNVISSRIECKGLIPPSGYRVSSAFYLGAMGLQLPDRAANSTPKSEEATSPAKHPQRNADRQTLDDKETMTQLEFDFGGNGDQDHS